MKVPTRYRKPSPYIRLADLQRESARVVIADVVEESLYNHWRKRSDDRLVLCFTDGRRFVLEGATLEAVIAAFGEETNDWKGGRVTLSAVTRGGRTVKHLEAHVALRERLAEVAAASSPLAPLPRDWPCPHDVHCASRSACRRLQALSAAKADVAKTRDSPTIASGPERTQ